MSASPEIDAASGQPIGPAIAFAPARRPSRDLALEGRRVRLVPLDPAAHADALYEAAHGPDAARLWLYLGQAPFPDRAAFREHLARAAAGDDPFFLAILDRATGAPLGYASYLRVEPAQGVIEVGHILFTPALQRTPAATEAMYLMARHAFEAMGYRRYEWKCNALNAPSRRAALRLGFRYEGLFRQHMVVRGRSRDTTWFAMLDLEWPTRRRAFERWLDPANFDADGQQFLGLGALNAEWITGETGLRRAESVDVAAFGALQREAYAENRAILGAEPLPLLVAPEDVFAQYEVWLLEEGGRPAGALVLDPAPDHLLIWSVASAAWARRRGGGDRMLAAAEARARDLGLARLRLYTGEKLARNVAWYERRGYAIERVEARDGRRVVHMAKMIG